MYTTIKKETSKGGIKITQDVLITPELLAEMFWDMDEKQQADFFCTLGDYDLPFFRQQMFSVANSNQLTSNGKEAMIAISKAFIEDNH